MKLTIIPSDGFVNVDGDPKHIPLDLSGCGVPVDVHALQWFDVQGWIEFSDPIDPFMPKPPNQVITELPQWANNCVEVWQDWVPPAPPPTPDNQPVTVGTQTI